MRSAPGLTSPAPVSRAALDFLEPYGIENFSEHYIAALSTLVEARGKLTRGDDEGAKAMLDALWLRYPVGSISWAQLPTQPFGINIGSPPCYYALRMLIDTADWHVMNPDAAGPARSAQLTVLLVGSSNGIEPRNHQEIKQGGGVHVQHTLEAGLLENNSAIIHDSLDLFRNYVVAMCEGALEVEVNVVHLADLDVSVSASVGSGRYFSGMTNVTQVWEALDTQLINDTDWWWLI